MASVAKGLAQMGVGIGILTETKITNNRYPKSLSRYKVIVSKVVSPNQGGVGFIWREDHDGIVKAIRPTTPNLLTFNLVTGNRAVLHHGDLHPPHYTMAMGMDDLQVV